MTNKKELSGYVYVAVYDSDLNNKFNFEIKQLLKCGWQIALLEKPNQFDSKVDMSIVNTSQIAKIGKVSAFIVVCESQSEAQKYNAILPDAFSILSALGGGKIERSLVESIDVDIGINKVIVGLNWSMVQAGDYCGIARSPSRGTQGARTIRPENGFKKESLKSLSKLIYSCDELSRSIGLAAINAFCNRPQETKLQENQKWGFASINPPGDGIVVVGDFGNEMKKRLPMAKVIEREPKQGQTPIAQANEVFANANKLIITGQTLSNGSLESILQSSHKAKFHMLLGPSVPLSPVLFNFGINQLCATAVHDIKATEKFISETGSMIMLDNLVQKINCYDL